MFYELVKHTLCHKTSAGSRMVLSVRRWNDTVTIVLLTPDHIVIESSRLVTNMSSHPSPQRGTIRVSDALAQHARHHRYSILASVPPPSSLCRAAILVRCSSNSVLVHLIDKQSNVNPLTASAYQLRPLSFVRQVYALTMYALIAPDGAHDAQPPSRPPSSGVCPTPP